jgi:hypothetical protein
VFPGALAYNEQAALLEEVDITLGCTSQTAGKEVLMGGWMCKYSDAPVTYKNTSG